MTEKDIQNMLYKKWVNGRHPMVLPNSKALGSYGEADLITVTKSNFIREVEIKRTIQDYHNDFNKGYKHWKSKHQMLEEKYEKSDAELYDLPNYFWFATTFKKGIEIPEHAGHIYVKKNSCEVLKKAPRIHSYNASKRVIQYIERGLSIRYWNERT